MFNLFQKYEKLKLEQTPIYESKIEKIPMPPVKKKKRVVKIIENINKEQFEDEVNNYLEDGYLIETSSCNSRTWRAILIKIIYEEVKSNEDNN